MSSFSRIAVAAALFASFGGVAYAQARSHHAQVANDRYYALSEGRDNVVVDRPAAASGAVAPSESGTVMGLRVPR